MARKIVVCSDGTGNSWSTQVSNVTHLIKLLDLSRPDEQVVFYDQGIGTDPKQADAVTTYREESPEQRRALIVLEPPVNVPIVRWIAKWLGLAVGLGLRSNVKQLYKALSDAYQDGPPGTRSEIYLIGFSRGAFTARVLAGLIHRCGLLPPKHPRFSSAFRRAYRLYKPHTPHTDAIDQFKLSERVSTPCVHFLGIWDTVKAYGGIWPRSLPHLRHNVSVERVCHAMSLDERRSWFLPTSWGGIDSDPPRAEERRKCHTQSVEEIWFRGSHSDVGGGLDDGTASKAPLRWMLNQAARAGVNLTDEGWAATAAVDPVHVVPFDSLTRGWLISEYIPRWELDNHFDPPKRFFKCGRTGMRHPAQFSRQQTVHVHSTVGPLQDIVTSYEDTQIAHRHHDEPSIT
jgi:uncharacterized protein (DUF2235 family)